MSLALTADTKAVLLLMVPLLGTRTDEQGKLLTLGEYRRLARCLHDMGLTPSALIESNADAAIEACAPAADPERLRRLLGRGLLLSQTVDRWAARSIWVVSRADPAYPHRIRSTMRGDAPPLLFGCGNATLLSRPALAVVGSRDADADILDYVAKVGSAAADADVVIVSGGAKGVDRTAMSAALERGGCAVGVLADSLERAVLDAMYRQSLQDERLLLISSYDPSARWQSWMAMQRNKLIYAAAEAALVAESALSDGGTWNGAVEQLDGKYRYVPVFVRPTPPRSQGLEALAARGARLWPDALERHTLLATMEAARKLHGAAEPFSELPLAFSDRPHAVEAVTALCETVPSSPSIPAGAAAAPVGKVNAAAREPEVSDHASAGAYPPAEALYRAARQVLLGVLETPMTAAETAEMLAISKQQAKAWLDRLASEGDVELRRKPPGYVRKGPALF